MEKSKSTLSRTYPTEDNKFVAYMIIPPDGGWGWIITLISFIGFIILEGITLSFAVFRDQMSHSLKTNTTLVAVIGSIFVGTYFASGIGAGFVMMSLILPPGFYFSKKRPIAMGLSSSGTGIGAMVGPTLMELFAEKYGWSHSILIEAGFLITFLIMGIFLRPLEPLRILITADNKQDLDNIDEKGTLSEVVETLRGSMVVIENAPPDMIPQLREMIEPKEAIAASRVSVFSNSSIDILSRTSLAEYKEMPKARPLYKTDVMYGGNLMRLEEYTEKETEMDYQFDVTLPATEKDIREEVERKCLLCPEAVVRGFTSLFDFKLLRTPAFLCFSFCGLLVYFSFHIPFLYIADKYEKQGFGEENNNNPLTIIMIGLGLASGRILSGFVLTKFPNIGAVLVLMIACFTAGLSSVAMCWWNNIVYEIICLTSYGFFVGIFLPLRSVIIVDFFGLHRLTTGTGMITIFQGIGSLMGSPIADFLYNRFDSANAPFYVAGVGLLLCPPVLFLMKIFHKRRR
uniref:Major facilitator superfamily (MFS) profile domain-containing protein n=1 Tax=Clastoptera arizonana TaxID=38151 RepID=A0A1B6D1I4_9HEMI